jgi:hypothetical protein
MFSIPKAAWRKNGASVPAAPGRTPSHTKHGPPESALVCLTAQYAENSNGIRGVLGVEAPAFTAGVSNVSSSGFAL